MTKETSSTLWTEEDITNLGEDPDTIPYSLFLLTSPAVREINLKAWMAKAMSGCHIWWEEAGMEAWAKGKCAHRSQGRRGTSDQQLLQADVRTFAFTPGDVYHSRTNKRKQWDLAHMLRNLPEIRVWDEMGGRQRLNPDEWPCKIIH